eukprot:Skav203544  [mRNA]  locus=scaffold220:79524:85689:+ [translate_table: standard]
MSTRVSISPPGWVAFKPGSKFRDEPGSQQRICHGKFWYTLAFDENGTTGKQINHCTGKTRPLRRIAGFPVAPASSNAAPAAESAPAPGPVEAARVKHPPQPATAGNGFPNLLTSANVTF